MSEINFSSGNKIAEAIDKRIIAIAKQVANKSTVNRTVFGRVTAKNNGLFSLRINNTVYTNVIALKNSNYINVGDKVVCLVPNNQFNDLLILGVADGSLLATSEYTLNQASSTELGGIKANNRTVEDQEVRIDPNTGFLYYSLGKSIESIEKTSTSGLVDTYTITYTDGTYTTFTVTNADQIDIQYVNGQLQWKYASETAWTTLFSVDGVLSTTSVNPIQNQVVTNAINNKIDINQGVSNVGKVLTVGSDGNVFPQDIPSSGGTIVNIAGVPQGTVDFTSDPQTQINLLNNSVTAIELTGSNGTLTATQSNILANYPNAFIILNGTIKLYRHYCTINGILIDRAIYCSMIDDVGSLSIININNLQWSVSTDTVLLNEISQTITGTKNFNTITANNLTINNRVEGEGSATSYSGKPITVTSYSVKYRIAPDGFKTVYGYVRWNRTSSTDSEGVVINFGTTFESTEYAVSVTVIDTSTNQYHSVGTYILDGQQTTSSVVVLVQNVNNSSRHAGISFIIQGV